MSLITKHKATSVKNPPRPSQVRRLCFGVAMLAYLVIVILYFIRPQVLIDIEGRLLDARFKLRGAEPPTDLVAIVAVDEKSISALGRWPWSREVTAKLIEQVDHAGAAAIGLDIVFSEPQQEEFLQQVDALQGLSEAARAEIRAAYQGSSPDEELARAIAESGKVVNGQFFYQDATKVEPQENLDHEELARLLASSTVAAVRSTVEDFPAWEAVAARPNIALIADAGRGAGYFNFSPGHDGLIRYAPLVMHYGDDFYPLLALQTLALYLDDAPIVVHAEEFGITQVSVGELPVITDELGSIAVNYRGPQQTIPTYSALDVLEGRVPTELLQDRMVLIGVTAIGVFDAHSTSFGPQFPGLEIQANVAENILQSDYITRSGIEVLIDLFTMLGLVVALALVMPRIHAGQYRAFATLSLLLLYAYGNYLVFAEMNLWLNLVYPLLAWLLTYLSLNLYLSFLVENRYDHVRSAFKHFLQPDLVDQLTQSPELLQFGGEQKELSILFTDIRNFTNLSEQLTPQQLAQFMKCYMDPMTEQVLSHNGTLDKYIGDAIMAIYGAPVPTENHPVDACNSALDMVVALDGIGQDCPELSHIFPVRMGVGINTGEVVVGNLGSSFHFTYTCLGDEVNLASRLEGLTKNYGVSVIVSENTYQKVKGQFILRDLDVVRVKGKQIPIRIYELRDRRATPAQQVQLATWDAALSDYRAQSWSQAISGFSALLEHWPGDKSCLLYIERCEHFMENPPVQPWDGVFTYTTK